MARTAPASHVAGAVFSSLVRISLHSGLLLAALLAPVAEAAAPVRGQLRADPAGVAARVTQQTNAFRAVHKLSALQVNQTLAAAAQRFAEYMASTEQYGHEADGRQPAERALAQGYEYCSVAENIGYQFSSRGFTTEELAERLVEGWEQSPEHRRNMLLPQVVDIGVGVARSDRTQRYFGVQMFGRPKSESAHFEIANRSDAAVRYELDKQSFTLPPRVTRAHQGCFSGTLAVMWPDGTVSPGFQPRDGARYTVQRDDSGHLRLQAN
ncbi:MAG: CAP domain-containing protein [Burkholderiaceae bacterium]